MSSVIRVEAKPHCLLCGSEGAPLYSGLRDRLFSAPGIWSLKQCPDGRCGLVWLDPAPIADDTGHAYADYYTHDNAATAKAHSLLGRLYRVAKLGYLANHFGYTDSAGGLARLLGVLPWLYPGRTAELDFSVMWLPASRRGRLLDVGSGSGWLVEHMRSLGWQSEGIDPDTQAVERACGRGLVVHHGGLLTRRFQTESFDAITFSHSIEHVHDPFRTLAEAYRVLRPGGRAIIVTPNCRSLGHRWFGEHWWALDPPRHLHLFSRTNITAMLARAGFARLRVFTSIREANGAYLAGRAIRHSGRYDMLGRRGASLLALGRLAQMVEALALIVDADCGEDLVAFADK